MKRILVVEDHPIMREMICSILALEDDLAVCEAVGSAEAALQTLPELQPTIALVDVSLEDMSGIELVRRLTAEHPEIACIMLSAHGEASYVREALAAGARGYVLKQDGDDIPAALRAIHGGQVYVSPSLEPHLPSS